MTKVHERQVNLVTPLNSIQQENIEAWIEDIVSSPIRLENIANQISSAVAKARELGNYILAKSSDEVAENITNKSATLIPGVYEDGIETFHYYRGMTKLVVGDHFDEFPVVEGGTLIANPKRKEVKYWQAYRSSHAVQLANKLPTLPRDVLIINTSRSNQSKNAGLKAGAVMLKREYFPMIDALTCDPGCSPGSDGRNAGIENVLETSCGSNCIACPVNEAHGGNQINDGCYLLTPNLERAVEIEEKLKHEFLGKATLARSVLIDGIK